MARKGTWEMLGELSRDAGILLLTFGFLDQLLSDKGFRLHQSVAVFVVSGALLASGIAVELFRPDDEE